MAASAMDRDAHRHRIGGGTACSIMTWPAVGDLGPILDHRSGRTGGRCEDLHPCGC
jgi:hypothetical protein